MTFDFVFTALHNFRDQKKRAFGAFILFTLFIVLLVSFQGAFFGHIQSLITTLGAYIEALLQSVSNNEQALLGYSVVSFVLADSFVQQALWKIGVAYLGLFISLFTMWNLGFFVILRKLKKLHKLPILFTFSAFTKKNLKWFAIYVIYTIIYLIANLKSTLIDQVLLGSTWQVSFVAVLDVIVQLLLVLLILSSYSTTKFFKLPNLKQLGIFVMAIITLFVFDILIGFLTYLSTFFFFIGFIALIFCLEFFISLFLLAAKKIKAKKTHESLNIKKVVYVQISILFLLAILAYPFASFFLIEGLENSDVLIDRIELTSFDDLASVLRTTTDELNILKESGVKVVIIEFADFDCPFCAGAQSYVEELHAREKVFVYRRHFPVTSIHPTSYVAALQYECFKQFGLAPEARSFLYGNQQRTQAQVDEFTTNLAIAKVDLQSCVQSNQTKDLVEHDIQAARALGMEATPTFYLVPLDDVSKYLQVDGANSNTIETFLQNWS